MKKEIYYCDICKEESGAPRNGEGKVQVIFTTEQNEGRSTRPYFEIVDINWCEQCRYKALQGNAIWATGAMGYNEYRFGGSTAEISKRQLHKMIEEEIWVSHTIPDTTRKYNISKELETELNAMFMKAHNLVLTNLLDYLKI